jgi:iron(III) transport system permease protein
VRSQPLTLPGFVVTIIVAALLGIFIAYPIGSVLVESLVVRGPMPLPRLQAVTTEALALLPEEERESSVRRWVAAATEKEHVEATAAAFALVGEPVAWDRQAPYSQQARDMEAVLKAVGGDTRAAVAAAYPTAHIMLHKRIALAFKVRDAIGPAGFDRLRSGSESRIGVDHYLAVMQERYLRQAALNSLMLASLTVLATVSLALMLAYGINAGAIPWPNATRSLLLLPLVAPPVLVATATLMLFGRRGLVTFSLLDQTLGLIDADETNLYGFFGVVLAQSVSCLPAALIVFDNVLRKPNGRLDEAAANLGAGHRRIFTQVTLPLAWPAIKRAAVLVFILSLTDFGNPALLGGDMPVLAGVVYDQILAYRNTPLAAALCVWLLVPPLLLYAGLEWFGRRKSYAVSDAGGRSELAMPAAWRLSLTIVAGAVGLLIATIYVTMALGAVTRIWGVDWRLTLGHFSGAGVDTGLSGSGYGSSERGLGLVWDSFRIAAMAAPLGGLLGIVIAYVVERLRPPGRSVIASLALIPAILPGIIFGVGYIIAFNAPLGFKSLSLTGTSAILVINVLFSNLFVGFLAARAALQRLDPAVDEAAESLGAGLVSRFWRVTLPMLRPALLLGTLYVFIDALTTFSSVIFLISGHHKLASVAIFNHAVSGDFGQAGAKSVALLALALAAMSLVWLIERQPERRRKRAASKPAAVAPDASLRPAMEGLAR